MYNQTMRESDLLFQIKLLKAKAAEFESGEKYVKMQEEYRKNLEFQNRRNVMLEKELARSHAETVSVRNLWFQTCEDILKEKELELAQKEKALRKMETEKLEALRQRDEALAKLHDKNVELYAVKTQLEGAQGALLKLTARINRDHTNSSLPSSRNPVHEKIQNSREDTGRRPGGQRVHAVFPEGLRDDVTYDGSIKAAAYLLNNDCYVPVEKTRRFLKEISGGKIDLSSGMVCNLASQFSQKTREEREKIFLRLLASPNMHADFTFGRMNGKQASVIICATPELVLYQGREKKGHEGIKDSPVKFYNGVLITDHEAAFLSHGSRHQECMAHVERYVRSSIENEPGLKWNWQLLEWLRDAIHFWNSAQEEGYLEKGKAAELEARYGAIMTKAREEYEYEPPSEYFRDGYNLFKRMDEDREDYLLFLKELSVEPTNNLAEQCARKFKRKAAQVMCFRSQKGGDYFCDGLFVLQTLKSEGKQVYKEVASRFNNEREAMG